MKRKFIVLLFVFLFFLLGHAQELEICRNRIDSVIEAINKRNFERVRSYLSPSFEMAGFKDEVATSILKHFITGFGDTIVSYLETDTMRADSMLTFHYLLKFKKLSEREAVFECDTANLFKRIEIGNMKVKVWDRRKIRIEYPHDSVLEIPFRLKKHLILVPVRVNGKTYSFILDTGSPVTVLNAKYFYDPSEKDAYITNSGNFKGATGRVSVNTYRMDLSHLEKTLKTEIGGLIGAATIQSYDWLPDYRKKKFYLVRPSYTASFLKANRYGPYVKIPAEMQKHILAVTVKAGGKFYKTGIDTGAQTDVWDEKYFAELRPVLRGIRKNLLSGAGKDEMRIKSARMKRMEINGIVYKNLKTAFTDLSPFRKSARMAIDGLLGYPFLHKRTVLISPVRKEILIFE